MFFGMGLTRTFTAGSVPQSLASCKAQEIPAPEADGGSRAGLGRTCPADQLQPPLLCPVTWRPLLSAHGSETIVFKVVTKELE